MALPSSGQISIDDILNEMKVLPIELSTEVSLDLLAEIWYKKTRKSKFNTHIHQLSDWHGESWLGKIIIKDTLK